MSNIPLRDILINARQESFRMRHFYLGVEHLFIALLEIQGGLTSSILAEYGLAPEYVVDAIRRKIGKGSKHRLWAGLPYTPRAEIVLSIANDLALEDGHEEIQERDLLVAICDEFDSVPIRVLRLLKLDLDKLADAARTRTPADDSWRPEIRVEFGPDFDRAETLSQEHLFILRRMFYGYMRLRVERRLTGFTKALILAVTPINSENQEGATVVVKIDATDNILDEAQRYENHVKDTLPLLTARLEDRPTAPETSDLAGIKYTLVANSGAIPQDLRTLVRTSGAVGLGQLLRQQLYSHFSKTWWQQRRSYRFEVWKEYDWLLPPLLTLELTPDQELTANAHVLKVPFNRAKLNAKLKQLEYGDFVALENFVIQRVDREQNIVKLAAGYGSEADKRAYKIEVRGLNLEQDVFYRGEVIERLVGRVWKTRNETLMHAARTLEPDFDLQANSIPFGQQKIPNPLLSYESLLDRYVNGSLSKIHGDLHLGNILVGPNNSAWLIDFAHTRDGHTLFDWAALEVSLLGDAVMPTAGESWYDARRIIQQIAALNARTPISESDPHTSAALAAVAALREIVQECLTTEGDWSEYYIALALCSLRAITFETMSPGGRRLMFLLAGLCVHELRSKFRQSGSMDTPSPEESNITDIERSFSVPSQGGVQTDIVPLVEDSLFEESPEEIRPQSRRSLDDAPRPGTTELLGEKQEVSDSVYFTAYYPKEAPPGKWHPLFAYVFRQFAGQDIAEDVQRQLSHVQDASGGTSEEPASYNVPTITATPTIEGIDFNPPSVVVPFFEDWHRFDFQFRTSKKWLNQPTSGLITFTMDGVIIGDLPISILIGRTDAAQQTMRATRRLYESVFVSYSPQDRYILENLQNVASILGLNFLSKVILLRNGQASSDEIFEMIERADIFQLFWSQAAGSSPQVEQEWRHALQLHGDKRNFVRPVYWDQPMPPAPPELNNLRFTHQPNLGQ